jgi:hypothetical protein
MSSFICSPIQFNSIEYYLTQKELGNDPIYCLRKLAKTANKSATGEEITGFVDTLRVLSVLCISLQYQRHFKNRLDAEIVEQRKKLFNNKKVRVHLNDISAYKSLQCISYQIEISHLTEIRKLTPEEELAMELLHEITCEIAMKIVRRLPEYNKTAWSL